MSYTVRVANTVTGAQNFRGTFESYGAAESYAREEAGRSRRFVRFEVWEGTPKNPRRQSGSQQWSGTQ